MNEAPNWVSFLPIIIGTLFLLCMLTTAVVCLVIAGRWRKNANKSFTRLRASLGGHMHSSFFNNTISIQGHHHGVSYELKYYGGGSRRRSSSFITVVIPTRPPFTLCLRKEDWDTKLSKQIGIATELETGIPDFDAEYFIRTNDPTNCRHFLSVAKHRAAIRHIHQAGYMLVFTRKHIALRKGVKPLFSAEKDLVESSEIKGVLNAVVVLVKGLPAFA